MPDVLTLKQLGEHLQLSERTIYRLLGRGQLPGVKVGGQWRFQRSVVDYWLDLRTGRMKPSVLGEMEDEWRAPVHRLSDALAEENALLSLAPGSRREIVRGFLHAVTFPEPVDVDEVFARVWDREQITSTAASGGAVILHTTRWDRRLMRGTNLLAVGRLQAGVDFGAVDGGLADILLLLVAHDDREHLILLARATTLCRSSGFLPGIRAATSAQAVVSLVRVAEPALFSDVSSPPR